MVASSVSQTLEGSATSYQRRWWALAVLLLCLLVIGLDNTIVNVALPTLARDLSASASQLQWFVDAYALVFAGLLLVAGSLGDHFGRKRLLYIGLLIFLGGSLGAAFSATSITLIIAQGVMGLGGACIMPSTLSITVNIFSGKERLRAIAIWSAVGGLGIILGPLTGGWLLEHAHWGAIFLVNVPIILLALLLGVFLIPESRDPRATPLDGVGTLLVSAMLFALLYGIIEQPAYGWGDLSIRLSLIAAVVLLIAFVLWEVRQPYPLLDVRVFRNRRFTAASLSIALVFFALNGMIFFLAQYFQLVLGYTTLVAGTRLIPVVIGLGAASPLSSWLVERVGTKITVATGMAVIMGSLVFMAATSITDDYTRLAFILGGLGVGIAFAMVPATAAIMGALPLAKAGVGSAMNDTTREVGGALGVAILGSVVASAYHDAIAPATLHLPSPVAALARNSLEAALLVAQRMGGPAGAHLATAAKAAFLEGMDHAVGVGVGFAFVGMVVAVLFLPAREQPQPAAEV